MSGFFGSAPYTEGTWTPVLSFATTGDLSVAYAAQTGNYARFVDVTIYQFYVQTTTNFTHSTASGGLRLTGLPFVSDTGTNFFNMGGLSYQGITNAATPHVTPYVRPNSQIVEFHGAGSGTGLIDIAASHVPTGGTVILAGTIVARS